MAEPARATPSMGGAGPRTHHAALGLLCALLALSFALRSSLFERTVGAPNLEASYHVLLTVTALSESPARSHWLLPTVTLGAAGDKGIPWGATIPTRTGDYVYTSFPPPGFLAPWAVFETFGLEATGGSLALFNFFLQALSCFLLFALLRRLAAGAGASAAVSAWAALGGVTLQVFSREALLSFGAVYWSQQLFQPMMIGSLLVLTRIVERRGEVSRRWIGALVVLSFLGPWTEWTGFVLNGGMVILLWLRGGAVPRYRRIALLVVVATFTAGVVIVLHYALAAGLLPALKGFARRFLVRTVGNDRDPLGLPRGYAGSFGLLIPLVLATAAMHWRRMRASSLAKGSVAAIVLGAAAFALLENVVMMQHATQFTFDRLKLAIPAAILLALALAHAGTRMRAAVFVLLAVALAQNVHAYQGVISRYRSWGDVDASNRAIARRVAAEADLGCAVVATSAQVRGYAGLLLHRGVFENQDSAAFAALLRTRPHCAGVYLEGRDTFPDLPRYTRALVYRRGEVVTIRPVAGASAGGR